MKNIKEVSKKIKDFVKEEKEIVLFADADLDGVTSAIMLEETIKEIGGRVAVFISNREKWGYGLSPEAVSAMKEKAPSLLISLDCGISNFEGAKEAKKAGFYFIIVDHHKTLEKLPCADIILDPHQKGDDYPFKKLSNGGVVYLLAKEFLGEDFSKKRERFLELASLSIIADMVPREEDNKKILEEGLPLLKERSSIKSVSLLKSKIDDNFVEKIVSLLNITKQNKNLNEAYLLLKAEDEEEIESIFKRIEKDYKERRNYIKKEKEKIIGKINQEEPFVFAEGEFPSYLAGALASQVIKESKKPVFLYTKEGLVSKGSVRMTKGGDAVDAMTFCKECLIAFGGHPEAAGFSLETEKINDFKRCLDAYFKDKENNKN